MHELLGGRAAMDPPLLVEACAEEDVCLYALNDAEPSTSDAPCTFAMPAAVTSPCSRPPPSPSPYPIRSRKSNPVMDFLLQESLKEQKRHEETEQKTERFLALFERMIDKL